jgi:hypothetical protein
MSVPSRAKDCDATEIPSKERWQWLVFAEAISTLDANEAKQAALAKQTDADTVCICGA